MTKKLFVAIVLFMMVLSACGVPLTNNQVEATQTMAALATTVSETQQALVASPMAFAPQPATQTPLALANPTRMPAGVDGFNAAYNPDMGQVGNVGQFSISGAPDRVPLKDVLYANGADGHGNSFTNTIRLGSELMLAEHGTILYGPDENPDVVANNPHGDWISPITQHFLGTETWDDNLAEGAFLWATGAQMTIKVGKFVITVESTSEMCTNNWFVILRGLHADGEQDSDRNQTAHFSKYVAGHTQVMLYPAGAYVSEENFLQVAELSHTGGRNCGNEGTSGLSVLLLDTNNGSYTVLFQSNLNQPWQMIESNWR